MKNNVIASERLLIRPITKSDTDAIHEYAFNTLLVHKVTSHCDSSNVASEKAMKKAGMMLIDNSGTRFYPKTGVTSSIKIISISPCFCSYDFPIRETRENSFGANCLINVCYFVKQSGG